jgi:hypothetical protein
VFTLFVQSLIDPVDVGVAGGIIPTYEAFCSYYGTTSLFVCLFVCCLFVCLFLMQKTGVAVSSTFIPYITDIVNRGEYTVDLTNLPG